MLSFTLSPRLCGFPLGAPVSPPSKSLQVSYADPPTTSGLLAGPVGGDISSSIPHVDKLSLNYKEDQRSEGSPVPPRDLSVPDCEDVWTPPNTVTPCEAVPWKLL